MATYDRAAYKTGPALHLGVRGVRSLLIRLHTFPQSKDFVSSGLNSLNLDGPVFPVLHVVSYGGTAVQTAVSLSFVYVGCVSYA